MAASKFEWAVCIGRFQLFHNAQLALMREALRLAPRCAVLIGSAHQARSPRNPFTWAERMEAIRLALRSSTSSRSGTCTTRGAGCMRCRARWRS